MSDRILQCDLHDYLEIACLYQIKVQIRQLDGSSVIGTPLTTKISPEKIEQLVLSSGNPSDSVAAGQDSQQIDLPVLDIVSMKALTVNPYFDRVQFISDE